jgi:RecB family exonuclease
MRMDEFEKRAVLMADRIQIDPLQRILLLREASEFKAFKLLKVDRDLVRFFSKSEALFKFFEELSAEHVTFETLMQADPYAEFDKHLEVLEQLRKRYKVLLDEKGLTDRTFIPENYILNEGFIKGYTQIDIYLEGYLSHFELELLQKAAAHTKLCIHYHTSIFNGKMLERFETCGIVLRENREVRFDLGNKHLLEETVVTGKISASVFSVEERDEQVAWAFVKIEEMVRAGISPEEIVLILPDEGFKEHFMLFDAKNNLNFAMGYDYRNGRVYKLLEALYTYWQRHDEGSIVLLERYGLSKESIDHITLAEKIDAKGFFAILEDAGLLEIDTQEQVKEKYLHFLTLFQEEMLTCKEWLYLWLKSLSKMTLDDVRGGKVTVMGVLETRGVSFRGVVIVDFNEGIVPASSSKDIFLNSAVRAFAGLPTRKDREALQKQYYHRLLQQADEAVIIYSSSENRLPSKFLYELQLTEAVQVKAPVTLLYTQAVQLKEEKDPQVDAFDAFSQIWSASKLKIWMECKRKYYYRYIRKIQAKKEEELNEGAFLHILLEHLYEDRAYYDTEEELTKKLHGLMEKLLPKEDVKNRYRKLLWREKLKGFIVNEIAHFSADWRVVAREVEVLGEIGGLKFKGRIDRIDQNATDTLVLDYKSGKVEKEPKKLNPEKVTDFQMSIYHQLLEGKYQNISLAFVKILENGEKQHVTLLEERNMLLAEHIVTLKQTKRFVAEKCEDLQRCTYCEFALMCKRGEYV